MYLIRESSENFEYDSSEATKRVDSLWGRGIDVTIGQVFRRGILEEEPNEMLVNEEINCDIKGIDEEGGEGDSIPIEATTFAGFDEGAYVFPYC